MDIKLFIPPIIGAILKRIKIQFIRKYRIGKYFIDISPAMPLPNNQKKYKLYDRFLPVLASQLPANGIIIDVGANIGDTAIAMLDYCQNPIYCVEPSAYFFKFLEKNVQKLPYTMQQRIKMIQKLAGTGKISGELEHLKGTASIKIIENEGEATHSPLDSLVDVADVILLKVDTDGFDFDVIKSAEKILTSSEPILFWENEISEDFQYKGFEELYVLLKEKNYKYIYVFDNFGNLLLEECNFETLNSINAYLYSMKTHNCTRTFHYTDILAATEKNVSIVRNAIEVYKNEWIKK
ncbi:MAG: FkbM family methyltransferase [Bacteroidales bacterium]